MGEAGSFELVGCGVFPSVLWGLPFPGRLHSAWAARFPRHRARLDGQGCGQLDRGEDSHP